MQSYAFIQILLRRKSSVPWVECGSDSTVISHDLHTWNSLHGVVEVCCGLETLGCGTLGAGFFPQLGVDANSKMVALSEKTHGKPGICSDICDPMTAVRIWNKCPLVSVLACGFNCQPFSLLEDQKGQYDARLPICSKLQLCWNVWRLQAKMHGFVPNCNTFALLWILVCVRSNFTCKFFFFSMRQGL